ncbi:MAG: hypothetical protein SFY81_03000 [Verrucomicrobiota bacterium]|nr:hypothetical protein [Verrucomicrobiota bacterium]
MLTRSDARRRWFGTLFLLLAFGLLIWGQTLLKSWLQSSPVLYVVYWLGCMSFTLMALLVAALDLFIIRSRTRDEKDKLVKEALEKARREAGLPDETDE